MSSLKSGYRLKGSVRETGLTGTCWQQSKLNKDENMIGSINAADRKTKAIIENDTADLSVHPRMENVQRNDLIWRSCADTCACYLKKKDFLRVDVCKDLLQNQIKECAQLSHKAAYTPPSSYPFSLGAISIKPLTRQHKEPLYFSFQSALNH